MSYRALTYLNPAKSPSTVLRLTKHAPLASPPKDTANVKFLLSPVNPADINVIQGVYPVKARTQLDTRWVGGNEGVAQVTHSHTPALSPGDWVIPVSPQLGTWRTHANIPASALVRVPKSLGLLRAASSTVNPATALSLLDAYPSSTLLQTTASSAVGEAVIQIARRRNITTLNFVRDKVSSAPRLTDLGADHVFNYSDLQDPSTKSYIKSLSPTLLLNALSGPDTTALAKLLAPSSNIVSYGALSLQPFALPTSLFIFNDIHAHGFWMHAWYQSHSLHEREDLLQRVADLNLAEPRAKILTVPESDDDNNSFVQSILDSREKVFLKFE